MPPVPSSKEKSVRLLDTTLRDGSYAINFQFSAADTFVICSLLERAGIEFIEIGHGVGIGASEKGLGEAAETDESYFESAAKALSKSKFGAFCIPGVATVDQLDVAAEYGMKFVRVGTNVTEVETAKPFIERAKKHGMFVASNFMKSYVMEPKQLAERARTVQSYGSDVLYIVDSAGGMFPDEVARYFNSVREICSIPLAFHAHNNLGLAIANTLKAIECGATLVDASLQGMGRSSGNAATEILGCAIERMGIDMGIDLLQLMEAGEKYVRPLIKSRGISSLDVTAGFAQFHSSYMGVIRKYASKYRVDPRTLIIELCKVNKVDAPDDLVESIAAKLKANNSERRLGEFTTSRFNFEDYFGHEQTQTSSSGPRYKKAG